MESPKDWVIVEIVENEVSYSYTPYLSGRSDDYQSEYTESEGADQCSSDGSSETQRYVLTYYSDEGSAMSNSCSGSEQEGADSASNRSTARSGDEDVDNVVGYDDNSEECEAESDTQEDQYYDVDDFYDQDMESGDESGTNLPGPSGDEWVRRNVHVIDPPTEKDVNLKNNNPSQSFQKVHKTTESAETKTGDQQEYFACKSDSAIDALSSQKEAPGKEAIHSAEECLALKHTAHDAHTVTKRDMFVIKTDVQGDTVEVHLDVPDVEPVFDHEAPSAECSTRFDFTPAATRVDFTPAARKSSNDSGMRSSGAFSSSYSAASGRRNPRAKLDNEVRSAPSPHSEAKIWATQFNTRVQFCETNLQGCPENEPQKVPQAVNNSAPRKATQYAVVPPQERQLAKPPIPDIKKRRPCTEQKPGIPHQLRSTACYQDGKVDVSILGDPKYLASTDAVNLQITLVHRQLSPNKGKTDSGTTDDNKQRKDDEQSQEQETKPSGFKGVLPPIRHKGQQKTRKPSADESIKTGRRDKVSTAARTQPKQQIKAYDFKQIPAKKTSGFKRNVLPPLQTKIVNGRPMAIKQQKLEQGSNGKTKKKSGRRGRKFSPQNFDIVNLRAQWPPFNTYLDPEASARYHRLITGLSDLYI